MSKNGFKKNLPFTIFFHFYKTPFLNWLTYRVSPSTCHFLGLYQRHEMKENDNEITFIWKKIADDFMTKYKVLLKITFCRTFSLWKTNVKITKTQIFLNLASRSYWAPPHHLHIWHSSLQLRLSQKMVIWKDFEFLTLGGMFLAVKKKF